ncbi:GNAT family N-acetyltransferase [Sporobolomyces koalae]|uniref:GNAT family N-acetyltransferase n=1 Tax=Sporobolomyces koalae TaxID=500713 RepID=UPI0031747DCF
MSTPASSCDSRKYSVRLCTTAQELQRCMAIRNEVFCIEQGYDPAIEVDEKDPHCDHFLLEQVDSDGASRDVGTLRCYAAHPDLLKLGRFAIRSEFRGTGAGRFLEHEFISHLERRQPGLCKTVTLDKRQVDIIAYSQCIAVDFYTRLGWNTVGDEFLEEGQPHIKIVKTVRLLPETEDP